jgi:DNA-3-methyladenine glycosylase
MNVHLKRVYDLPAPDDGVRVLVDRVWPRGITRDAAHIDEWLKELGPSTELRKWFNHDPPKFAEFRTRYRAELDANPAAVAELQGLLKAHPNATLLYMAHDTEHCNAVVLTEYLHQHGTK